MSRTSKAWEALQSRISQTVETVTRSARIDIVGAGIDEIDPPEDIDQYAEWAKNTALIRANMRRFTHDVWEDGYRVEGPDRTIAYFEGESEDIDAQPPEDTPEGGFLTNSAVFAGEKHQDFYDFGKETTWQRWVRGTVLVELLKADREDPESEITGFHFIRPETVYPQVLNNTNILLPPDVEDLPDDVGDMDYETTPRNEVAAYIQFDDESILGLRYDGYDKTEIPLSQNDVHKQVLEPDIGGDIQAGEGVFGTSILSAIDEDIAEYKQIKRDRAEAIGRKAYGIWTAQFTPETLDLGNSTEVIEWADDSIESTEQELRDMGPGDVLTSDANINLERHDGDVPDLDPTLQHYVDEILSALPAPKALTGFADDINRDVVGDQREAYGDLVSEERKYQETQWTQVLRTVAERKGLPTEGLQLKLEPKQEENPVKTLDTETVERMSNYISTLATAAGPQLGPTALVDREAILDILEFPEIEETPEEVAEEMADMGDEAAQEAFEDILGMESLASFAEGDVVDTPDGLGVVSGVWEESWEDDGETIEASSDSPAYTVALVDGGFGHFSESDVSEGEFPDTEVDSPEEDLAEAAGEAMQTLEANGFEALGITDWDYPDSWDDSPKPNRLILLDAWSSMGGQFDCGGGACCKGTMRQSGMSERASDQFCASMKDRVLGTEMWRGWGPD